MDDRTPKAQARREEILKAAGACFREKGFQACGVSDICARLGISPGHLYYYFKSKDAILHALLERLSERTVAEISVLAERPDAIAVILDGEQLIRWNRTPVEETYLDAAVLWEAYAVAARGGGVGGLTARHRSECRQALRILVLRARERGEVRADADLDQLLTMLEMYIVALQLNERVDPGFELEAYRKAGFAMLGPFLVEPAATSRPARRA